VTSNNRGVGAGVSGVLWLAHSAVLANTYGAFIYGGTIYSYRDNNFHDNGTPVSGGSLLTASPL
jgi:hypothetical protein